MARSLTTDSRAEVYVTKEIAKSLEEMADRMGVLMVAIPVVGSKTKVLIRCWGGQLPLQTFINEAYRQGTPAIT
jgi:hypothetical protein